MKVLLFTHSQDIDGIGNVVLGKHAFEDIDYVPCKTFEITKKVEEYFDTGLLDEYDQIFITDLCIKEPLLTKINNSKIKDKIRVLGHHKSEIEEGNDKYDFVAVIVDIDGIKQCGTSLFYKYLVEHNYLKRTPFLDDFVEQTRQYDVWDWKKIDNQTARRLNIIFERTSISKYLELVSRMKDKVEFDLEAEEIIEKYEEELNKELHKALKTLKIKKLVIDNEEFVIGFVDIMYYLRNELVKFFKEQNIQVDIIGMNVLDLESVSYRSVNKDKDCSKVGKYFGGKGHMNAASNPKANEKYKEFVKSLNLTNM